MKKSLFPEIIFFQEVRENKGEEDMTLHPEKRGR